MELGGLARLSSGALSGTAAAAIGVAGAAAIVGLYLLRLRRRRVVVAFAPLWLGAAGEQRATRRARRLRHWLSLALALALFAALLVGAVDPRRARGRSRRPQRRLPDRSLGLDVGDRRGGDAPRRRQAARGRARARARRGRPRAGGVVRRRRDGRERLRVRPAPPRAGHRRRGPRRRARRSAARAGVRRRDPARPPATDGRAGQRRRLHRRRPPRGAARSGRPRARRPLRAGRAAGRQRRHPVAGGAPDPGRSRRRRDRARRAELSPRGEHGRARDLERRHAHRQGRADARPRRAAAPRAPQPVRPRRPRRGAPDRRRTDLPLDDRASATIPPLPRRRILRVGGADLYLDGALLSLGRTVRVDRLPAAEADRALARAARLRSGHLRRRDPVRAADHGPLPLLSTRAAPAARSPPVRRAPCAIRCSTPRRSTAITRSCGSSISPTSTSPRPTGWRSRRATWRSPPRSACR